MPSQPARRNTQRKRCGGRLERAARRVTQGPRRARRKLQRGRLRRPQNTQERIGRGSGALPRVTRTDSQEEQGFGAHEASPKERLRLFWSRANGKRQEASGESRAWRGAEREPIVGEG